MTLGSALVPQGHTDDSPPPVVRGGEDLAGRLGLGAGTPGTASVVEIVGGRWSGKTTLLADLTRTAQSHGWTVASATAAPGRRDTPFGLFVDALDALVERFDPDRLGGRAPDHLARLAPFFPAVAATAAPPAGPAAPGDPYYVCRALRALVEALAPEGGLLIALDDLHWADQESLRLLDHLVEHPVQAPVVVAVARRQRRADGTLNGVLSRCAARGGSLRVRPAEPTEEEAIALLPADLSRVHCETLLTESGRNPGLLRAFAGLGRVPGHTDAWSRPLPPDLLAHTLRDFRALSPEAWKVVRAAAVLHEPFEPADLKEVAQIDETALWAALDELIGEELLRPGERPWQLGFDNPLLRVAAYQSAGPGWLLGAHAQAAGLLSGREHRPEDLAHHLERSAAIRDVSGARVLLDAAARRLWQAPAQAVSWIRTAMTLGMETEAGTGPRDRLLFGKALALAGRLSESLTVLAPLTRGGPGEHGIRAEAVEWRALAHRLLGRPDRAEAELAAALRDAGGDAAATGDALRHAWLEHALHTRRADVDVPAGHPPVPADAPRAVRGRLLAQLAAAAARGGMTEAAERHAATARQLLESVPATEPAEQLDGLYWLGAAEATLGRPGAACAHYERGLRIAETYRLVGKVPLFAMALSALQQHTGDLVGAARHAACAEAGASATDSAFLLAQAARLRQETAGAAAGRAPAAVSLPGQRSRPAGGTAVALDELSRREREVAVLVSAGRTNQQIARELELSHKTVETYLGRIFQKLRVQSRAEVAATVGRADRLGLIDGGVAMPS
ncbi:LuxR C-terminal-related transcriptional regulator [Streptomyces sp. NPDC047821]|uniref:LuxR C-terminal-related transcriptional regulator n=1 Tax=Streptomyces sp. NPDC047821 TaxID=3365488 RepID=UPI003717EBC1